MSWIWRYLWFVLWRNRFAIAIASLVWLVWRSGTQPRRLAYPCQQAAAANLGFLAVLFIPEAARRHAAWRGRGRRAFALATGSVALAGVLTLLISAGVTVYSNWVLSSMASEMAAMAANIPAPDTLPPEAVVAINQTKQTTILNADDIEAMVRKAVADAGGLEGIIQPGDSVVIKPNLVNDNTWTTTDPTGVTTDPRVVAAILKLAKEAGAGLVSIAEGSAGPADWNHGYLGRDITWYAYSACGYDGTDGNQPDGLFDYDTSVPLIDLNDAGTGDLVPRPIAGTPLNTELITLSNGVIRNEYYVPKAILRPEQGGTCDVLISVPTLKNHENGSITLSLKNQVGCAPSDIYHVSSYVPSHRNQMKWDLVHWAMQYPSGNNLPTEPPPFPRNVTHENPPAPTGGPVLVQNITVNYSIVDLNLVRPNDFAVVDGLVGITNGPVGTDKIYPRMKMIIAGRDSVAVDTIGTLVMGYDPLASLYIGWAWNRGLGNRDTSMIKVVGDQVADVRRQFPCSYENVVSCVELIPPSVTNMVPTDGATVFKDVKVAADIGDASGISKAELRVKYTAGPNLLTNGDFELGSAGWNTWRGSWGTGEVWNFNSIETGCLGERCLRLTSGHASFGVYQEVPVIAGKTYKIDAYWKGKQLGTSGDDNWYEVLILDGAWDFGQADGNPNTRPYDNPSQPVFNEMYGYDSHTYSMTDDFGWEWTHDLNDTLVDTMDRDGLRTASSNVMTVVLKAGANGTATGSSGWFDNISLVETWTVEELVAEKANPTTPLELIWHSTDYPNGEYDLRLTVYDIALNETHVARHVHKTDPPGPVIAVAPIELSATSHIGTDPADGSFEVWNIGIDRLEYKIEVDEPWLSVSPVEGWSDGEYDTIAVFYNTAELLAGTHTATITVSDNGSVSEEPISDRTIEVTLTLETVKADYDGDGDVDQEDFGFMQICQTGPGIFNTDVKCAAADLDKDGDADVTDMGMFRWCFSGPDVLAPATCDDNWP